MHAYAIQDSKGMVKLDAMENPHRLPAKLQAELGQRLGALALNRYPDGRVNDLRKALADYAGMPEGFDIMLGNGSDELISLLAMACDVPVPAGGKKPVILAPLPGFVMYAMSAQLQGLDFVGVPLTADFELDAPAMLAAIAQHQPAIIYLAYPNNPTANLWDAADMARVVAAGAQVGSIVVIDEAYQPTVKAGKVMFMVDNTGATTHGFGIVAAPAKISGGMVDESTYLAKGKQLDGGQGNDMVSATLKPGKYELVCIMAGHYAAGQHIPFTVTS